MEYILAPKSGRCFLCDAFRLRDDRAHLVLRRGRTCAVLLNRYPYNNGHLMIAPLRHAAGLTDLTAAERHEMMDLADEAIRALRAVIRPEGFNVGVNLGKAAGAGLDRHVHLHVVPRWSGDTNFMPVTAGVKVIPQALDDLWARLRKAFGRRRAGPKRPIG